MPDEPPQADHAPHGHALLLFLAATGLVVLAGLALLLWNAPLASRHDPQTENAYVDGDTVPIAAHVQGYIRRLPIADNQLVRAGDVIAEIDDADYRADLAQAQAQVAVAQANLAALDDQAAATKLQVAQAEAGVDASLAGLVSASPDATRQRILAPTAAGLGRDVDAARANLGVTQAGVQRASAQLAVARQQLVVLAARRAQAEAILASRQAASRLAAITLGWTRVLAPVDGTLGARAVRVGSLVSPGARLVSETPLGTVWVTANFTERQIAGILPGRPARLRIDAFPHVVLDGHVAGLSPGTGATFSAAPADNTTGNFTKVVQRVPVKIAIDWHGSPLLGRIRPGMSLVALVLTGPGADHAEPLVGTR